MKMAIISMLLLVAHAGYALEVGEQAPCVVLQQIAADGSESEHCIRDPKTPGQKVVLEFFQSNCSDCLANLPNFGALAARFGKDATFRLVGIDRNEASVRKYLMTHAGTIAANGIETALDSDRDAKNAYGVTVTPTLFILNDQNVVLYKHTGVLTLADTMTIEQVLQ